MPKTLKLTRLDGRQDDCPLTGSSQESGGVLVPPHTPPGSTCSVASRFIVRGFPEGPWRGRGRLLRQHVTKSGGGESRSRRRSGKATKVVATHSLRWVKSQAVDGGSPGQPLQHFVGCFVKFPRHGKSFFSSCVLPCNLFVFFTPCPKVFRFIFSPHLFCYFFPAAAALTMKFLTADCLLFNVILPVQCDFK